MAKLTVAFRKICEHT